MKLKSFGCSFIWGSEMRDAVYHPQYPSKKTWPALLARHLDMPYKCYAQPGGGNLQIAEQVISQATLPIDNRESSNNPMDEPAVFVINWTFIDRFDYQDPNDPTHWSTLRPGGGTGQEQLADFYYRNLHSEYRDKLVTLMNMKMCIDILNQTGHEFIMTYMDDLIFDGRWHMSTAISRLQTAVKPWVKTWNGLNMVDYARSRGHEIGQFSHPLETAHEELFDYALANFGVDKIKTS